MAVPVPFLPHRFHSAAPHYLAGRPPYPPRLIARVAALTGLAGHGAGPIGVEIAVPGRPSFTSPCGRGRREAAGEGAATGTNDRVRGSTLTRSADALRPPEQGPGAGSLPEGEVKNARVLDLGCGPGQLALAFAPYAAEVVAVDPEPAMLRLARQAAASTPIRFVQASSNDLGPAFGRFRLAVMGRSFHWMDRAETLRRLDALIDPGGAVALFGDAHPEVPDNAWRMPWREVLGRYRDPGDSHPLRGAGWVPHETMLLDSAFCRLDSVAAIDRRHIPVVTLVERALSRSGSSPARLGDRVEALSKEVVQALEPFTRDGMITEVVETHALIATREAAA